MRPRSEAAYLASENVTNASMGSDSMRGRLARRAATAIVATLIVSATLSGCGAEQQCSAPETLGDRLGHAGIAVVGGIGHRRSLLWSSMVGRSLGGPVGGRAYPVMVPFGATGS